MKHLVSPSQLSASKTKVWRGGDDARLRAAAHDEYAATLCRTSPGEVLKFVDFVAERYGKPTVGRSTKVSKWYLLESVVWKSKRFWGKHKVFERGVSASFGLRFLLSSGDPGTSDLAARCAASKLGTTETSGSKCLGKPWPSTAKDPCWFYSFVGDGDSIAEIVIFWYIL